MLRLIDWQEICRRCERYFNTPQMFCECCGMQLRASPHCGRVYKEKEGPRKTHWSHMIWLLLIAFILQHFSPKSWLEQQPGINDVTKYVMSKTMKKSDRKNSVFLKSLADIQKLVLK